MDMEKKTYEFKFLKTEAVKDLIIFAGLKIGEVKKEAFVARSIGEAMAHFSWNAYYYSEIAESEFREELDGSHGTISVDGRIVFEM